LRGGLVDRLAQAELEWKPFDKNSTAWRTLLYRDRHEFRMADLIAP